MINITQNIVNQKIMEFNDFTDFELKNMNYRKIDGNKFVPRDSNYSIVSSATEIINPLGFTNTKCDMFKSLEFMFNQKQNRDLIRIVDIVLKEGKNLEIFGLNQHTAFINNKFKIEYSGTYPINPITNPQLTITVGFLGRLIEQLEALQDLMDNGVFDTIRIRVNVDKPKHDYGDPTRNIYNGNVAQAYGWVHFPTLEKKRILTTKKKYAKALLKKEKDRAKFDISIVKPYTPPISKTTQYKDHMERMVLVKYHKPNNKRNTLIAREYNYGDTVSYKGYRTDRNREINEICAKKIFQKFFNPS